MIKVLYIHHNADKGGSSNSLRNVLEVLKDNPDMEIVVACPEGEALRRFNDVGIRTVTAPTPYYYATTAGVEFTWLRIMLANLFGKKHIKFYSDLIERETPDIIHLNEIGLIEYAKLGKEKNCKVVMHARVAAASDYPAANRKVVSYINKYVDKLIAIDQSVVVSLPALNKDLVEVVYNPVHVTDHIKNMPEKKMDQDTFNVIYLSNFLMHKGILDTIQAAILLKDEKNIRFSIAGSNVKHPAFYTSLKGRALDFLGIYPDLERRVKSAIKKNKLTNVELMGDLTELHEFFNNANVIVMPTLMNEPSRCIFEAGIYGIPSIISLKDKIEDIVEDNVNGFIVNEHAPEEIANNIRKLADDRELCKKMGQHARAKFIATNDSKASAEKIFNIYIQLYNV